MRMFIGFRFKDQDYKEIIKIQKSLNTDGNYTRENNIHLTLIFLGELENKEITKAKDVLKNISSSPFTISTTTVEMLRDIVILKVKNNDMLQGLYDLVFHKLSNQGFKLDKRKYFPHITLVRRSKQKIHFECKLDLLIDEIILFSSNRINSELIYNPEYIHKL